MLGLIKSFSPMAFLSLFTSFGTLICCALPALLVSLGMGAAVAGLTSTLPQLIWISEQKVLVFSIASVMIALAGISIYRARNMPCPIDPKLRAACLIGRKVSVFIFSFSVICLATGAFFAFGPLN